MYPLDKLLYDLMFAAIVHLRHKKLVMVTLEVVHNFIKGCKA